MCMSVCVYGSVCVCECVSGVLGVPEAAHLQPSWSGCSLRDTDLQTWAPVNADLSSRRPRWQGGRGAGGPARSARHNSQDAPSWPGLACQAHSSCLGCGDSESPRLQGAPASAELWREVEAFVYFLAAGPHLCPETLLSSSCPLTWHEPLSPCASLSAAHRHPPSPWSAAHGQKESH